MSRAERLTAQQLGITCAPSRTWGARRIEPQAGTGDAEVDWCIDMATVACRLREHEHAARYLDMAASALRGDDYTRAEIAACMAPRPDLHPETMRKIELEREHG